jgi:hypothetical protein
VSYDPASGVTAVRANDLTSPVGVAVDAGGTLYVADAGDGTGGEVKVYPGGGGATTMLKPNGVTTPIGVAVDASGSVVVSDGPTGAIVRVPNEGGTLNAADAVAIARNPSSGGGVALDGLGNLYRTDPIGATVYAEQRTASSIDFGNVAVGASSKATVVAENAGNMSLALSAGAASFLTQPATKNFAILAGPQNDCLAATALSAGAACDFVAEFAPPAGTAAGDLSDSASFDSTAVDAAAPIALKGTVTGGGGTGPVGFTIALDKTSLTVKVGGSAATMVSVTPQNGFSGNIIFSCSGLPAETACSFSPASVTAAGNPVTTQLTITANSNSARLRYGSGPLLSGGAALAGIVCCCFGFRRRRGLWMALLVVMSVAGVGLMSGCGVQPGAVTTASTVMVTASSGSLQSSAPLTLTVQR